MRSRVQVAVALAIAGATGLLFLGLMANVRESAKRSSCRNNFRSLGLALHTYHDTNGRFPRAVFGSTTIPLERRLSWIFDVDSYLESYMDPERFRYRSEPWDSEGNLRQVRRRNLYVNCPASEITTTSDGYTLTHYVGATGVGADAATLPIEDVRCGLFGFERKVTSRDIKDGAENTIAVTETSVDNGPWMAGGRPTSRPFDPEAGPAVGRGAQFGGFHHDGVNAGFLDASVRFLPASIDPEILAALFTVAGGETVQVPE